MNPQLILACAAGLFSVVVVWPLVCLSSMRKSLLRINTQIGLLVMAEEEKNKDMEKARLHTGIQVNGEIRR